MTYDPHDDDTRVAHLFDATRAPTDDAALRRLERHAQDLGQRRSPRFSLDMRWGLGFAGALAAAIVFLIARVTAPALPGAIPERWANVEVPALVLPGDALPDDDLLADASDLYTPFDDDLDELLAADPEVDEDLDVELGMDALGAPTLDDDLDALIFGLEAVLQES